MNETEKQAMKDLYNHRLAQAMAAQNSPPPPPTQEEIDREQRRQALYAAMANSHPAGMMGGAGVGYPHGGLASGYAQNQTSPPPPSKEEMLRDLLGRATRKAAAVGNLAVGTIAEHCALVKQLLEDFEEGASYLQAQIPMVEAAFKDRPALSARMVECLNRAYTELCIETFGDRK